MSAPAGSTKYAVHCPEHGLVYLTRDEYDDQMDNPDRGWVCTQECGPPNVGYCGRDSSWSDSVYGDGP